MFFFWFFLRMIFKPTEGNWFSYSKLQIQEDYGHVLTKSFSVLLNPKISWLNSFMTEPLDWFLYDNGLRHKRVNKFSFYTKN